jgi:hypothetical protein
VCGGEKSVADVRLKVERLEQVESVTYRGSTITWDGRSTSAIKRLIAQAKTAFMAKRTLLCSKSIRLETRKQYVKNTLQYHANIMWAVAFYGSKAWTIGKTDQKRIQALVTWCWRRML